MKLDRQPRTRRNNAADFLRSEFEPQFDLRAVALLKAEDMRSELDQAPRELRPIPFMSSLLHRLANTRAVETALGVSIIPESKQSEYDEAARHSIEQLDERALQVMEGDPKNFASLAAWVQLFPEQRRRVDMDLTRFERTTQTWSIEPFQMDFIREAVFLLQLRPDKRQWIRELVSPEYFQEFIVRPLKDAFLTQGINVEKYVEWLADYLLIHPEDRDRFSLTQSEVQIVQQAVSRTPKAIRIFPTSGRLRDAAIILGRDAKIDDRGVVQIFYASPVVGGRRVGLPERDHA